MKQLTAGTLLALLLVVGNVKAEGTEVKSAASLEVVETKLVLEDWMMNESIWNEKPAAWVVNETENNLEIENWMTDENTWEPISTTSEFEKAETETKLELESWMTADNVWNR
jgi:hypothetical protein